MREQSWHTYAESRVGTHTEWTQSLYHIKTSRRDRRRFRVRTRGVVQHSRALALPMRSPCSNLSAEMADQIFLATFVARGRESRGKTLPPASCLRSLIGIVLKNCDFMLGVLL